eukprot:m.182886 g.182886  ORF g.182886 m.182886 type:complete len:262 (-) comp25492_c4_seq1:64-849(-)
MAPNVSKEAVERYHTLSCGQLIHCWSPDSCSKSILKVFLQIFPASFKMYGSLFLINFLISSLQNRRKATTLPVAPETTFQFLQSKLSALLTKILPNTLYSTLFLSTYGANLNFFVCFLRHLTQKNRTFTIGFLPGFLASVSLYFERKSRRSELGVYVSTQAAWCLWRYLVDRGYVVNIPFGPTLIFATSLSLFLYHLRRDPQNTHGIAKSLWQFLFRLSSKKPLKTHHHPHHHHFKQRPEFGRGKERAKRDRQGKRQSGER